MRFVAVFAALLLLAAVISLVIAQRDQSLHGKFRINYPLEEITVTDRPGLPAAAQLLQQQQSQASAPTVSTKPLLDETKQAASDSIKSSTRAAESSTTSTANDKNDAETDEPNVKKSLSATILITAGTAGDQMDDGQMDGQSGSIAEMEDSGADAFDEMTGRHRHFRLMAGSRPSTIATSSGVGLPPFFTSSSGSMNGPLHPRLMLIEKLMGMHFGSPFGQSMHSIENSNKLDSKPDEANVRIFIQGPSFDSMEDQRTRPIDRAIEPSLFPRTSMFEQKQSVQNPDQSDAPALFRFAAASMLSRLVAAAAAAAASGPHLHQPSNSNPSSGNEVKIESMLDIHMPNGGNSNTDEQDNHLENAMHRIAAAAAAARPRTEEEPEEETVPVLLATVAQHGRPDQHPQMMFQRPPFRSIPSASARTGRPPMMNSNNGFGRAGRTLFPPVAPESRESRESSSASNQQPLIVMLALPMGGASEQSQLFAQAVSGPSHPMYAAGGYYQGPYSPNYMQRPHFMQRPQSFPPSYPLPPPAHYYGMHPPPPYHRGMYSYYPPHSMSPPAPQPAASASYHPSSYPPHPSNYYQYHSMSAPMPAAASAPHPPPAYPYTSYYTPSAQKPQAIMQTSQPSSLRSAAVAAAHFGQPAGNDDQPEAEQHMIVLYDADSPPGSDSSPSNESNERDEESTSSHFHQALHQLISAAATAANQKRQSAMMPPPPQSTHVHVHQPRPIMPWKQQPLTPYSGVSSSFAINSQQQPNAAPIRLSFSPVINQPTGQSSVSSVNSNAVENSTPETVLPVRRLPTSDNTEGSQQNEISIVRSAAQAFRPTESNQQSVDQQPIVSEQSSSILISNSRPSSAMVTATEQSEQPETPAKPAMLGQPATTITRVASDSQSIPLVAGIRPDSEDTSDGDSEASAFSHFAQIIRSVVEQQQQQEQQQQKNLASMITSSAVQIAPAKQLESEQPSDNNPPSTNNNSQDSSDIDPSADSPSADSTSSTDTAGVVGSSSTNELKSTASAIQNPILAQESIRRPAFIVVAEESDESK